MAKPTKGMKEEAAKGLAWRKEFKRGGTRIGLTRANQIVNDEDLSEDTIKRMYSFFSRHEQNKQAEGFRPGEKGYPSNGRIAWALWGGDAGFSWSKKLVGDKMNLEFNTIIKSVETVDNVIKIEGFASTTAKDRANDIIVKECWEKGGLDNYQKNPILLFNHDYNRPVGKVTSIEVRDEGLYVKAEIVKASSDCANMVEAGVLKAMSVSIRPKVMDYDREDKVYYIKDAELVEISVVSVPANPQALFEVVKSLATDPEAVSAPERETIMEKDLEQEVTLAAERAAKKVEQERIAKEKAAAEATEAEAAREKAIQEAAVKAGRDAVEGLLEEIKKSDLEQKETIDKLTAELKEHKDAVANLQKSKRQFVTEKASNWEQAAERDLIDAKLVGLFTNKGWNSDFGQKVIEKVNAMSGIAVGGTTVEPYETVVSTALERDIEIELVIAPLFRQIQMNAASMIMPIVPDAGYAEFIAGRTSTNTGINPPHGNLSQKGDAGGSPYGGVDLTDNVLTTKKIMSISYLANETEEDSIIPMLPLINESIVRSHARTVEHAMLLGGHSTAAVASAFDGLVEIGKDNSNNLQSTANLDVDSVTSDDLLTMRKNLGKYGLNQNDVIYIVSQDVYFNLLEDPEYKDLQLVGNQATKLTGEVGSIYNSRVLVSPEFGARSVSAFHAVAVNPRNFVVPRIRGVTLETDYSPKNQYREVVGTQRLGFKEIIAGASAVCARNYSATAS